MLTRADCGHCMSGAALMSDHTCCHHLLMSMGKLSWLSASRCAAQHAHAAAAIIRNLVCTNIAKGVGGLSTNAESCSPTFIQCSLIFVPFSLDTPSQGYRKLLEAASSSALSSHSSLYAPLVARLCRSQMPSTTTHPFYRGLLLVSQSPGVRRHCQCRAMAAASHPSYCIPAEGTHCKDCSWSGGEHS